MTKIRCISDTHNNQSNLESALNGDFDAFVHAGDFTDMALRKTHRTSDHAYQYQKFMDEALTKKGVSKEEKEQISRYLDIKRAVSQGREDIIQSLLQQWEIQPEQMESYSTELEKAYQAKLPVLQESSKEASAKLEEYLPGEQSALARIIRASGKKGFGVGGNHDRNSLYTGPLSKTITFVDQTEGVQNVNGITISGAGPTCYEGLGFDPSSYSKTIYQGNDEIFGKEGESRDISDEDSLVKKVRKDNPVVLVVHKGAGNHATVTKDQLGYHKGLEKALEGSNVRFLVSGHSHNSVIKRMGNRLDLVVGPNHRYDVEINPDTKEVVYIDVFKYNAHAKEPPQQEMRQAA